MSPASKAKQQGRAQAEERPKWVFKNGEYERKPTTPPQIWHKGSWDDRFRRDEHHRGSRSPPVYSVQAAHSPPPGIDAPAPHSNYVRKHTHTHTFHEDMSHTHTTILKRTWRPGSARGPEVVANYGAFCGEIGQQVACINRTLDNLKARCEKIKQNELQRLPPDADTAALRAALGDSVAMQIGFYQRCMQIWTGMSAEQQQQFVAAMSTAMQRWQEWTADERETFLMLFSQAAAEEPRPLPEQQQCPVVA